MSGRGRASATQSLIAAMRDILEAIHPCSVRAVAYQLFTRKLIPSMSTANVARVSRLLVIAREEGTIAWGWIVDPTRQMQRVSTWSDPTDFARSVTAGYRRNKWDAQPRHIMVWSEKGTVESDAWVTQVLADVRLEVRRVALTDGDTASLGAEAAFPAADKVTDSRYPWFVEHYGTSCWELDALSPVILRARVENAIVAELDPIAWDRYVEAERLERESIAATVQTWTSILQPDRK